MDKTHLLRSMREGHAAIAAAVAAITDDALLADAPGMPGWTRKDVLAHVEFWHHHSADVLAGLRSGEDAYADWPTGIDPFNERVLAENRSRSVDAVRAGEAASFDRLMAAVEDATEHELFDGGLVPWLDRPAAEEVAGDTFGHYPDHLSQLAPS